MRSGLAIVRAEWLASTSYRLRTILSIGSVVLSVVPMYFIAEALQPTMAEAIKNEGGQYFGFLIAGLIAMLVLQVGISALPATIGAGINQGTFEALLATPASLPSLLAGMVGVPLIWSLLRVAALLLAGVALGVHCAWGQLIPFLGILMLTLAAYLPFGLIAAGLVLVFRTAGPIPQAVSYVSIFLGGVYYPTHIIPSWIQNISQWVPLTYGLRALRRVILDGAPLSEVSGDLLVLAGFAATLGAFSIAFFTLTFRHAKRAGTLTQY
jgi:ABC-2 type transport system permease protein